MPFNFVRAGQGIILISHRTAVQRGLQSNEIHFEGFVKLYFPVNIFFCIFLIVTNVCLLLFMNCSGMTH